MELQHDPAWRRSAVGRPLSLSLPFGLGDEPLKGPAVEHYFDNLLPDSPAIRKRVAERFRTGSVKAFDLLSAIGRDCVGALQFLPEGAAPEVHDRVEGVEVDGAAIERHLLEVVTPDRFGAARGPDDDFRISLAGAQEKDAFLRWNGHWMKPRGATPTTHIFKLPPGLVGGRQADFSTSVDNEWLCLRLLATYGLPVPTADIASFGQQRVLVVERFDRVVSNDGQRLLRLLQEDFCQATGTSPLVKYEAEGGPGLGVLFNLLQQSVDAERDLRTLMASQLLFWMNGGGRSMVRVVASRGAVASLLAKAIPAFGQADPGVLVVVREADPLELATLLAQEKADLAVCRELDQTPRGWSFTPVMDDQMIVVAGLRHPLAARRHPLTVEALANEIWLSWPLESRARAAFDLNHTGFRGGLLA